MSLKFIIPLKKSLLDSVFLYMSRFRFRQSDSFGEGEKSSWKGWIYESVVTVSGILYPELPLWLEHTRTSFPGRKKHLESWFFTLLQTGVIKCNVFLVDTDVHGHSKVVWSLSRKSFRSTEDSSETSFRESSTDSHQRSFRQSIVGFIC